MSETKKRLYAEGKLIPHNKGMMKKEICEFLEKNTNKYLCKCGCGYHIKIIKQHFYVGIPSLIKNHGQKGNKKYGSPGNKNPMYGKHHTKETKEKISKKNLGKVCTREHRERIGQANKGKPSSMKGKKHSEEVKRRISLLNKGRHHTDEAKKKISRANTGKCRTEQVKRNISETKRRLYKEGKLKSWNWGLTKQNNKKIREIGQKIRLTAIGNKYSEGRILSKESRMKMSATKQKIPIEQWNGFKTPINRMIYASINFKQWRKMIFERDKYTCQECSQIGMELRAHHIKPFAKYPLLRFDVNNGITLCLSCHNKIMRVEECFIDYFEEKMACTVK